MIFFDCFSLKLFVLQFLVADFLDLSQKLGKKRPWILISKGCQFKHEN